MDIVGISMSRAFLAQFDLVLMLNTLFLIYVFSKKKSVSPDIAHRPCQSHLLEYFHIVTLLLPFLHCNQEIWGRVQNTHSRNLHYAKGGYLLSRLPLPLCEKKKEIEKEKFFNDAV